MAEEGALFGKYLPERLSTPFILRYLEIQFIGGINSQY